MWWTTLLPYLHKLPSWTPGSLPQVVQWSIPYVLFKFCTLLLNRPVYLYPIRSFQILTGYITGCITRLWILVSHLESRADIKGVHRINLLLPNQKKLKFFDEFLFAKVNNFFIFILKKLLKKNGTSKYCLTLRTVLLTNFKFGLSKEAMKYCRKKKHKLYFSVY